MRFEVEWNALSLAHLWEECPTKIDDEKLRDLIEVVVNDRHVRVRVRFHSFLDIQDRRRVLLWLCAMTYACSSAIPNVYWILHSPDLSISLSVPNSVLLPPSPHL